MRLEDAVEAPRLHVEKCGALSFEPGFSEGEQATLLALEPEAQAWPEQNLFFGGVHSARRRPNGSVEGTGDPRRCGQAIVV